MADEAWAEHYYGPEPAQQPRPAGPDPARDARIDAYRDRERRRAARALDRLVDLHADDVDIATGGAARMVAAERFVEQVGDYVLARLGEVGCLNTPERPCPDDGTRYACAGCSFASADIGRMTEHCVVTGHAQRPTERD